MGQSEAAAHRLVWLWLVRNDGPSGTILRQKSTFSIRAERTGFEPADQREPVTELATRRFRPLSHLSRWDFGVQSLILGEEE